MTFTTRIATATTIGSILAATLLPGAAFAKSTTVTIKGNGADSNNTANVTNNSTTNVTQKSSTVVLLGINSSASTGGNKASKNTNGTSNITTGDAKSKVSVNVTGGSNVAVLPECGCDEGETTLKIKDNGADSKNKSEIKNTNSKKVYQESETFVGAEIDSDAKTGKNKTKKNTGGSSDISTGDSKSIVDVTVEQGTNAYNPTL